ncbi:MAG: sigma-70 family RNA polymerase sigma factor [Phycisphaerales bacterium]
MTEFEAGGSTLRSQEPDAASATPPAPLSRAAIERIWTRNRRWVAAILIAHKPSDSDVDDLLQEVAMALVAKGHTIRDEAAARGWLRTVAINAARLAGRHRTRRRLDRRVSLDHVDPGGLTPNRRATDRATDALTGPGAGPDRSSRRNTAAPAAGSLVTHDDPGATAAVREIHQRLTALPEIYREPLMLRAVRGLPSSVIGEVLGLSEAAVNTRLARARRLLRETIDPPPDPDDD